MPIHKNLQESERALPNPRHRSQTERPYDAGTHPRLTSPLLRPEQAAALLAVRTSWIYDAVRTGRLPCLRIGRHIRFTQTMLEDWLQQQ